MYKSFLLLCALLLSNTQNASAQCTVSITASNTTACVNAQPFTLTATPGATSYTWYDPNLQVIGTSQSVTTYAFTPGVQPYTVEAVFGTCTAVESINMNLLNPIAVMTTANSPGLGATLNLSVTTIGGATFQWNGPNMYTSTMQNPVIPNATCWNTGVYTVTVTAPSGCVVTDNVNVTLSGQDVVEATNNGPVCTGDLLQLSATNITNATYTWTGPNGFVSTQQNPGFVVSGPVDGGVYTVVANQNGCISTDTTLVISCDAMQVSYYIDVNNNCIYDPGIDNIIAQPTVTEIDSNGIIIDTISSIGGFFYIPLGAIGDVYTFKTLSIPGVYSHTCPSTGIVSHTLSSSGLTDIHMGIECNTSNGYDLAVSASNPTTNAIWQMGYIYATNNYCSPINATVTLVHSPNYQYASGNPSPVSISGNTVTWSIPSLSNSGFPYNIYYLLYDSNGPLTAGDTTHSYLSITPSGGDLNLTNNTYFHVDTVVASYDPNAITAFPAECVEAGTKMQYMIQFENLGNAPAENIYILDTLPTGLEESTMELVMSSHNMFVTKLQEGGYNILRFDFPNIMLADSSNHAERHGMLVYTIDLSSSLPYGAEVFHRAGIYFDYNDVVMTNNERTSICVPSNVSASALDAGIMLYPNPAGDELTIQTDGTPGNAIITNSLGQIILEQPLTGKQNVIDIHSLSAGVYYVNIKGADHSEVLRFIKM